MWCFLGNQRKGGKLMGRNISTEKLLEHKKSALCRLESYIDSLIKSPDAKIRGKADKFSY